MSTKVTIAKNISRYKILASSRYLIKLSVEFNMWINRVETIELPYSYSAENNNIQNCFVGKNCIENIGVCSFKRERLFIFNNT